MNIRQAYIHFNIHHSYFEKVFFPSNYAFITGMFLWCLYRGKHVWFSQLEVSCKVIQKSKVQSYNITKLFKRSKRENTAHKTHEIENFQDELQTAQKDIVEKLKEDHPIIVTEASSSSALNPQLHVSAAVCTTQSITTVSQKLSNFHKNF